MLAEVRSVSSPRRLRTPEEFEDFEQELVDQYAWPRSARASPMRRSPRNARWCLSSSGSWGGR